MTRRSDTGLRPHPTLEGYYSDDAQRRGRLEEGFDATADCYDRINAVASFGSDRNYRRRALEIAGLGPGMRVLDVGCGTGITAGLAKSSVGATGFVVGLDPSTNMLAVSIRKARVSVAVRGTADALPFDDGRFDFVTITFALRHVADLRTSFSEFNRVLKPGGKLLILEISTPSSGWRYRLLRFHLKRVAPLVALLYARRRTARWLYDYCWESHEHCVRPSVIVDALKQAGFVNVSRRVELGILSAYLGVKGD